MKVSWHVDYLLTTMVGKKPERQHASWDGRTTLCGRRVLVNVDGPRYGVLTGTRPDCLVCLGALEQRAEMVTILTNAPIAAPARTDSV